MSVCSLLFRSELHATVTENHYVLGKRRNIKCVLLSLCVRAGEITDAFSVYPQTMFRSVSLLVNSVGTHVRLCKHGRAVSASVECI